MDRTVYTIPQKNELYVNSIVQNHTLGPVMCINPPIEAAITS